MCLLKTESGYTLVEMLLSLSIFTIIITFIVSMVPLLRYHLYSPEITDQMQWEMFLNQAKREIWEGDKIMLSIVPDRILIWKGEELIIYERYIDRIRRRVDGRGHQLILFNIRSFRYEEIEQGIKFIVTHQNGKKYEGEIFFPQEIPITYSMQ
ncbi:competence type IV pilus minor pilin ComGF [Bacillus andreraoultii]|uniref:competence type IV pilus minor pilin ComGF n=1 Tax=Bacillus andreraoultii TaxID=1499685 RepID=UPI00053A64B0|nr:competence type IV pilus minor pilin ComGF [Bacillus andreraoultii]